MIMEIIRDDASEEEEEVDLLVCMVTLMGQ